MSDKYWRIDSGKITVYVRVQKNFLRKTYGYAYKVRYVKEYTGINVSIPRKARKMLGNILYNKYVKPEIQIQINEVRNEIKSK